MRSQPRPDQPLVRMVDERRAPFVQAVFRLVNRDVKIFARVRANQFGEGFVKDSSQQRRRCRAGAGALAPACRTVNLRANVADLQSDCHDKTPRSDFDTRNCEELKATRRNNTAAGSPRPPTPSECLCPQASTS